MKHLTCLGACLFFLQMLHAQSVALDSSFAQNGYVNTYFSPPSDYGSIIDVTTDQQLVLAGGIKVGEEFYFSVRKYSSSGDSLSCTNIPVNINSFIRHTALKLTADGGLLVADLGDTHGIIKIDPNGQMDSTFGTGGHAFIFYNSINDILVTQDNRILVAGENLNDHLGVLKGCYVIVYDMNGQLDTTFADHGKFRYLLGDFGFFYRIHQLPDGKILVAGCSMVADTGMFHTLVKLLPNGTRDSTFGINGVVEDYFIGDGENFGLLVQPDQKIVVCGGIYGIYQALIARYLPDGSRDASFGTNGAVYIPEISEATDILMLPNGKLLVYGRLGDLDYHTALVQLLPNGARDPNFRTNGVFFSPLLGFGIPMKMKLLDDNKIVATGKIRIFNGNSVSEQLQMQGFVLDMNVGVVASKDSSPKVWAYPNPVRDAFELSFSLETAQQLQFDLYDLQGKLAQNILKKTAFETGNHTVHLMIKDGLPAGNYLLTLSSDGKPVVTVQLMKN